MESPVIFCFLPFDSVEQVSSTVASLKKSRYPLSIMLLLSKDRNDPGIEGCRSLFVDDLYSTETIDGKLPKTFLKTVIRYFVRDIVPYVLGVVQ